MIGVPYNPNNCGFVTNQAFNSNQFNDSVPYSSNNTNHLVLWDFVDNKLLWVNSKTNLIEAEVGGGASGGGVQSVTGLDTDNTDPLNPIVQISVDGVTITGNGISGDPLTAPFQPVSVDGVTITGDGTPGDPLVSVSTIPTLQQVLDNNHDLVDGKNFQGTNAGNGATSASNSNFIGAFAGYQANDSTQCNFIGLSAGYLATNADNSNFLGQNAGSGATSANNSNFLGQGAGNGATNAAQSNFIGNIAGQGATDAVYSNFLGRSAGFGATSVNNSNFIGQSSGYGAANASNSNFFGNAAGFFAANAYLSNFIGYQAGQNSTGNNVNAFGNGAGIANTLSGMTIFSNASMPTYADFTAASAAITVGLGATAGCTYLYHDQATNSIGAVRL